MLPLSMTLTLLIGPTVPAPAPPPLMDALQSVEVTRSERARSGFQITFELGRSGPADLLDSALMSMPMLRPYSRVIIVMTINAKPTVLMDGVVTERQSQASSKPGASTLTLTGEDLSVMMAMKESPKEHPAQTEALIALVTIAKYAQYGLIPMVLPPPSMDVPLPIDRVPNQVRSDREYLEALAARHGYIFQVQPGPVPFTSTAYWGPAVPKSLVPQPALTVNMGSSTNVGELKFSGDPSKAEVVKAEVLDRETNVKIPVMSFGSAQPPLALMPAWLTEMSRIRKVGLKEKAPRSAVAAMAAAMGQSESTLEVAGATGEVDTARYGRVLEAPGIVGVRGAGFMHDGLYRVKKVTHRIKRGEYKQQFELCRDGWGSITPVVRP